MGGTPGKDDCLEMPRPHSPLFLVSARAPVLGGGPLAVDWRRRGKCPLLLRESGLQLLVLFQRLWFGSGGPAEGGGVRAWWMM